MIESFLTRLGRSIILDTTRLRDGEGSTLRHLLRAEINRYWLSNMRSDELLLMKMYDTGAGGQAHCEPPEYFFQNHATDDFVLQSVLMSR